MGRQTGETWEPSDKQMEQRSSEKNFHLVLDGLRGHYCLVALIGHIPQPVTAIITELHRYFLSPFQKTCGCLPEY